jgi:hypothetical protein
MSSAPYNICCPEGVISGREITKENRKENHGSVSGGAGSMGPEIFQRAKTEEGTGVACPKTNIRINHRTLEMSEVPCPMIRDDGFDWTENFDGCQNFGQKKVLINFKSVVGGGGIQTRTTRNESYPFVEAQLRHLNKKKTTSCYFANIFDGDESHKRMRHFDYLLKLPEYSEVKKYVYVGDLKGYFEWLKAIVC